MGPSGSFADLLEAAASPPAVAPVPSGPLAVSLVERPSAANPTLAFTEAFKHALEDAPLGFASVADGQRGAQRSSGRPGLAGVFVFRWPEPRFQELARNPPLTPDAQKNFATAEPAARLPPFPDQTSVAVPLVWSQSPLQMWVSQSLL